jgi:hypothetical protein
MEKQKDFSNSLFCREHYNICNKQYAHISVGECVNYFMWINDVVWSQTQRQICF